MLKARAYDSLSPNALDLWQLRALVALEVGGSEKMEDIRTLFKALSS